MSLTTPTISRHGVVQSANPCFRRCPTAFPSGQKRFANVSLTTTVYLSPPSPGPSGLPASTPRPSVEKYLGVTGEKCAEGSCPVGGAGRSPTMNTEPQPEPSIGKDMERAASFTPG